MELGSIHPDEQSARRAITCLIGAGIEPERVKLIRPRVPWATEQAAPDARSAWKAALREMSGGATLGAAIGGLACLVLVVFDAAMLREHALSAVAWIVGACAAVGAVVAGSIARRRAERQGSAPRARRGARGWAVVVHARDSEQSYIAARALARARGLVAA